jgi:hypothetical protein
MNSIPRTALENGSMAPEFALGGRPGQHRTTSA